jgi:hypothetical protein
MFKDDQSYAPRAERIKEKRVRGSETEPARKRGRPKHLSEEQELQVVDLCRHGRSISSLAGQFNVTSRVIKYVRKRHGLTESSGFRTNRVDLRRDNNGDIYFKVRKLKKTKEGAVDPTEDSNVKDDEGVSLLELENHHCRWPIGKDRQGKEHFCGKQKHDKTSYCEEHYLRSIDHTSNPLPKEQIEHYSRISARASNDDPDCLMEDTQLWPSEHRMRIGDESFD